MILTSGCAAPADSSGLVAASPGTDPWQYGIRPRDTRDRVDELLGGGERMTPDLTEYAASGVSIWFAHGRVVKLNFATLPWPVNTTGNFWIRSDRRVAWGLSINDDEAGFRRASRSASPAPASWRRGP